MKKQAILSAIFCLALLPHAGAWAQKHELRGAGSTFAAAAYTSWAFRYAKERNTTVMYHASGSGDGVRQIVSRDVDFGATDHALGPEELKRAGLLQFPTLVGGVVPVFNLPSVKGGQLRLTGAVLAAIFAGRIANWAEPDIQALNPDVKLPNLRIKRIVRAEDSGTTASFGDYLSKVDQNWATRVGSGLRINWPGSVESIKGNEGVAAAVLATPGAIGYVSANQVARSHLAYALLQNRNRQFVAPTDEALAAAVKSSMAPRDEKLSFVDMPGPNVWPITDATYILIEQHPKSPERVRDVLRFFYWAFLRGDEMAAETGYVPLPSTVQARVVASFREVQDAQGRSLDFMSGAVRDGMTVAAVTGDVDGATRRRMTQALQLASVQARLR